MRTSRRWLVAVVCSIVSGCSCSSDPAKPGSSMGSGGAVGSGGAPGSGGSGSGGATGSGGDVTGSGGREPVVDAGGSGGASAPGDASLDTGTASPASFKLGGVATWHGGMAAAYSIIHDDVCDDSVGGVFKYADPEQTARGIHGGYGVITSRCDATKWQTLRDMIGRGHDVFNHSSTHPCMTKDTALASACDPIAPLSVDWAKEIDGSTNDLKTNLKIPIEFFIFPYDVCDPAALTRIKGLNYLGARCGTGPTTNPSAFTDSFKLVYDVYGPAYSTYITNPVCKGVVQYETTPAMSPAACRTLVLQQLVDDAITRKEWAIREVHGFEGDPDVWEALPLAEYKAHLDYVKTKMDAGLLWAEGPTPVLRYRWARQYCALPTLTGATLKFGAASADCAKYATVLSYLVTTTDGSDPTTLKVQQGGKLLPVRRIAKGSYAVDADPTKGDATIVQ